MSSPGRPSHRLVPERLKALRQRAGWSQSELGRRLYRSLGRPATGDRTAETGYQRVELRGVTDEKTARQLAQVLAEALHEDAAGLLAFMRGGPPEAPPNRTREIAAQLRRHQAATNPDALAQALALQGDVDDPVFALAGDIAQALEGAHLGMDRDRLARLSALTGWSPDELLRPIGARGHWLLTTETRHASESVIAHGVGDLVYRIRTAADEILQRRAMRSARILMSEAEPWLRVVLECPEHSALTTAFSFVRCVPKASGIDWVKPTEWDRFWLGQLTDWAYDAANHVAPFGDPQVRPADLRRLRLVIERRARAAADAVEDPGWTQLAVHAGAVDELPGHAAEIAHLGLDEHAVAVGLLGEGLRETLAALLPPLPPASWRFKASGDGIRVESNARLWEIRRCGLPLDELRLYRLRLVEDHPPAGLRTVPWRADSILPLVQRLAHPASPIHPFQPERTT